MVPGDSTRGVSLLCSAGCLMLVSLGTVATHLVGTSFMGAA